MDFPYYMNFSLENIIYNIYDSIGILWSGWKLNEWHWEEQNETERCLCICISSVWTPDQSNVIFKYNIDFKIHYSMY